MAVKEVNEEESFVFCGCCFGNVAISDRFEESLHVSHFNPSMSCECGTCTGLSLDFISSPQSLDYNLVLVMVNSTCLLDLKIIQCGLM